MSVQVWNAILNIITNIDYLAIPVAFVVLRNLREPDVPPRVLVSRILFVLFCGAHHGVMAAVLLTGEPLWVLRTTVNVAMAGVSCWSVVEHLLWARVRKNPVSVHEYEQVQGQAAALAQSNADLQQFAYVASHDLKEPLRMITSYAQLLERRFRDRLDDDARDFIGYIVTGSARMQDLINDLLTLSRVDTRGRPATTFPADGVLDEVLENLRLTIDESGAQVVRTELPTIVADRTQIGQVFQNLIANAVKYRANGAPQIEIGGEAKTDHWLFWVRDNGMGIDPEHRERIFVIFQRLHGREEYGGTGMGLALCKRIVDRHGGRIWVDSSPGSGSTFYFSLPRRIPETDGNGRAPGSGNGAVSATQEAVSA